MLSALTAVVAFLAPLAASTLLSSDAVGVVWTFQNETWIENLAVRQNGAVLCTSLSRAAIYQVDPFGHTGIVVHQFDNSDGILGLSEIANDVFVVVSATINLATTVTTPGSAKIWRIDMTAWSLGDPNAVSLIASLPDVGLPDGVATLDHDRGTVLVTDADKGIIWKIETTTGAYSAAIQDPTFEYINFPVGVDGLHIYNNEAYFTNLATNAFGKVPITANGGAAGPVRILTTSTTHADDFAIGGDGTSYVGGDNTLWRVLPDGTTEVVVGGANNTVLQGITSAQFGRTRNEQNVLYMATQGGMLFLPAGAQVHGGQLLAINVGLIEDGHLYGSMPSM